MNSLKIILGLSLLSSLVSCSSSKKAKPEETTAKVNKVMGPEITHERVNRFIESWPTTSKAAAHSMISKYGVPQEITPTMLIWNDNRPFKRTIVHKEEITHNFPFPHADVLEQVVNYRVPANKMERLQRLNGSISFERTTGELTAHCDREETNLISLNLADAVIRGVKSVDKARTEFAKSSQNFMTGNSSNITNTLMFNPSSETADADMAIRWFKGKKGSYEAEEAREADKAQGSLESDNLE